MVILGDVCYDSEFTAFISVTTVTYTFLTVTLDLEPFSINAFTLCVL